MASPKSLLNAWHVHAKKNLGQHFLTDPSISKRIAHAAGIASDDVVMEIGPGLGALTIPVSKKAHRVITVEKDIRLIPILKDVLSDRSIRNVEVIQKNVLQMDLNRLGEDLGRQIIVVGNLPYHLSSQILIYLIRSRAAVKKSVLMFQKELASRITASPGNRAYGRLSVLLQYCARIKRIMRVDASQFFPTPKVDSEVLHIEFHGKEQCSDDEEALLFEVVKAAFGKRRKTLKNALSQSALGIDAKTASDILFKTGIDPTRRAETLTVDEYVLLTKRLKAVILEGSSPM